MATNPQIADAKESLLKIASSAISASKTGWTRARQFTEEKIGQAEKTEYDAQFENLCSRADRTKEWTEKLLRQTEAFVQPNPGTRVEEYLFEKLDRKTPVRPTNSFLLGQTMQDAGQELGPGTTYGASLVKAGAALKKIGNSEKDLMQKAMSHYLHPLKSFLDNDMKTITKERRMLAAKRLDLDACKTKVKKASSVEKMKQAESELRVVQADFDRQYEITKLLLDGVAATHANHLRSLQSFVEAMGMYYAHCQQSCAELQRELQSPLESRADQPISPAPPPYSVVTPSSSFESGSSIKRKAKVLYDYDAADPSELSLLADEVICVYSVESLDSDWMMAERGNQRGKVPITYLELL